jgi:hypothetical protein
MGWLGTFLQDNKSAMTNEVTNSIYLQLVIHFKHRLENHSMD